MRATQNALKMIIQDDALNFANQHHVVSWSGHKKSLSTCDLSELTSMYLGGDNISVAGSEIESVLSEF